MGYQPEYKQIVKEIVLELEHDDFLFNEKQREALEQALKNCYDTGYEDGMTDGKEISERPISG
ncbi:hypothetical protein SAMN05421676_10493 [Salinibacillus kushneri]|uniref:Uncharacterized protein n=1 Tax=Salinibacillus kushneri TaxID=237682 RepID=A0A1I0DN44_9BACI|nr:hypothetical protein [Salinibacillus kushneri]SET33944.1 hypothetical protein SAMN05421676_10493 [Salinibacillus kushneri]